MTIVVGAGMDFAAAMGVCLNLKDTLSAISVPEKYSGVKTGILEAAVGEDTKVLPTSRLLHV